MSLNELRDECFTMASEKGWHESDRTFGDYISLMHSELSEALEEHRNGNGVQHTYYGVGNKPEGVPIELADVLIRIFDFCGRYNIDIEEAVRTKIDYNAGRSHRHGGKVI